ncbi:MAG TPA: DinB family protein [Candidatus Eisenbacteria bacterium]|nr:DinB family protein [Candidatus Eisenbacteria bacterium]
MTEGVLAESIVPAVRALRELETLLGQLSDADLHRAHPDGGWTCAQVVSHIHLSGLLWIAALERIRHQPAMFMYREELGHDAVGAPPHSAAEAAGRIASLRAALELCVPAVDGSIAERELEVPPFGTFTVGAGAPLIAGHLTGHCGQVRDILQARGLLPG